MDGCGSHRGSRRLITVVNITRSTTRMWDEVRERVRMGFAEHNFNLSHDPVRAHWDAAAVSTALGLTMAVLRGAVVAGMSPPAHRWAVFASVARSTAPLYCIPFTLGVRRPRMTRPDEVVNAPFSASCQCTYVTMPFILHSCYRRSTTATRRLATDGACQVRPRHMLQ